MRKKIIVAILTLCMAIGILSGCKPEEPTPTPPPQKTEDKIKVDNLADQNTLRAVQIAQANLFRFIDKDQYDETGEIYMYKYYLPKSSDTSEVSTVWFYGASVEMCNEILRNLAEMKKADSRYGKMYDYYVGLQYELYENMGYYLGTTEKFKSYTQDKAWENIYGVSRTSLGNEPGTAFVEGKENVYDDQMWIIRDLIEAYELTGREDYLKTAEYLTEYCLDGWDKTLNPKTGKEYGGITWGNFYETKHTCSNGPIIAPLVWLSQIYKGKNDTVTHLEINYETGAREEQTSNKSEYYLDYAKRVYDFCWTYLRRSDNVFYDLVGGDSVDREYRETLKMDGPSGTPLTYNSGTPLSGAVALYEATGSDRYLDEAKLMADAAFDVFADGTAKDGYYRYQTRVETIWFNQVLLRGFVDVFPHYSQAGEYVESFQKTLDYAYDNYYRDGMLPRDLLGGWNPGNFYDENILSMDMWTHAATYGLLGYYERDLKTA